MPGVNTQGSSQTSLQVSADEECLLVAVSELEVKRVRVVTSGCSSELIFFHVGFDLEEWCDFLGVSLPSGSP